MASKKRPGQFRLHIIQVVKWTTMSFACLMTFSLGIFLGKQFSDSQKLRDTSLVQSFQNQNIKSVISKDQDQSLSMNLTDENNKEISLMQDTEETQERSLAGDTFQAQNSIEDSIKTQSSPQIPQINDKKSNNNQEKQTKTERQNTKSNTSTVAISHPKDPQDETNETKQKENIKSENYEEGFSHHLPLNVAKSLDSKYTIRLGVYDQERKARAYVEELKDEGLNTFYMLLQKKNKSWYRVSLGVYADKLVAKKELNRILKTTSIQTGSVEEILK